MITVNKLGEFLKIFFPGGSNKEESSLKRVFRLMQLQHSRLNGRFDHFIRRIYRHKLPSVKLPDSILFTKESLHLIQSDLRTRGWCIPEKKLDTLEVTKLTDMAFQKPAYWSNPEQLINLEKEAIPKKHPRYYWRINDLIRNKIVQSLIMDSGFHLIAQNYLGCRPMLTGISMWLNPPYEGSYTPHTYHYDNDGPGFLKIYFYLTDVTEDTGAHTYIQRTHGRIKPKGFRNRDHFTEKELLGRYGKENEIIFSAPAGTIIVEDTAGFHRGRTPVNGYRLLMQWQYSIIDIPSDVEPASTIQKVRLDGLDPEIRRIVGKFYC